MNSKTVNRMKYFLCMFGLLGLTLSAQGASFDCGKAGTKVEKVICGDVELSKLDDDLTKSYQQVLEKSADKQNAAKEQRQWLKQVRNACQDVICLEAAYQKRIYKLMAIQKGLLGTSGSKSETMTLLYSEDDSICKPLLAVYQTLTDRNNHDSKFINRSKNNPSDAGYWEDVYPDVFSKAGFTEPPHLDDDKHEYEKNLKTTFYKLTLAPNVDEQVVLVQDYPYGGGSDRSSDVYISKSNEDISTECSLDQFALIHTYTDQSGVLHDFSHASCDEKNRTYNNLAFATLFNMGFSASHIPHAVTLIKDQYIFRKGSAKNNIGIYSNAGIIQRIYLFNGQPIFTARDGFNNTVVYKITTENQMNDICYFAKDTKKFH